MMIFTRSGKLQDEGTSEKSEDQIQTDMIRIVKKTQETPAGYSVLQYISLAVPLYGHACFCIQIHVWKRVLFLLVRVGKAKVVLALQMKDRWE